MFVDNVGKDETHPWEEEGGKEMEWIGAAAPAANVVVAVPAAVAAP